MESVATAGDLQAENRRPATVELLRRAYSKELRRLRKHDDERFRVEVTVKQVVPDLGKALVESDDGILHLSISERTAGVPLGDLRPGQRLQIVIQGVLAPKVHLRDVCVAACCRPSGRNSANSFTTIAWLSP